ncbi:hypothetical protein GQ54DRAFT_312208 [Martensiomyces pterosporus]|nr:hypothetical protein GQ54DRAFT_312208 [Martensiomyces pterosporus]
MEERSVKRTDASSGRISGRGSGRSRGGGHREAGKFAANAQAKDGAKAGDGSTSGNTSTAGAEAASKHPQPAAPAAVATNDGASSKGEGARRRERRRGKPPTKSSAAAAASGAAAVARDSSHPGSDPKTRNRKDSHAAKPSASSASSSTAANAGAQGSSSNTTAAVSKTGAKSTPAPSANERPKSAVKPKPASSASAATGGGKHKPKPGANPGAGSQPSSRPSSRPTSRPASRSHESPRPKSHPAPSSDTVATAHKSRAGHKEHTGAKPSSVTVNEPPSRAAIVPSTPSKTSQLGKGKETAKKKAKDAAREKAKEKAKERAKERAKEKAKKDVKGKGKEALKPKPGSAGAVTAPAAAAAPVPAPIPKPKEHHAPVLVSRARSLAQAPKKTQTKPVTKVCVRLLPPDLPEHVFWRSIEPALPWFDPENAGTVVQMERLVLGESDPELAATATTEPEAETLVDGPQSEPEPVAEQRPGDSHVSPLGPTKTALVDVYESANLAKLDSEPYWRQYIPGKIHKSKAKPASPSRAYILFETAVEVDHFYRNYHGHVFSKNNITTRAVVELAAYQYVPCSFEAGEDNVEGTIDDDPDFIAFLSPKPKAHPAADRPEDGSNTAVPVPKPLGHLSYAAAASVKPAANGIAAANGAAAAGEKRVETTPLINYLREIKSRKKSEMTGLLTRKGVKAVRAQAHLTDSSRASSTSATSAMRPGDAMPKKARRRRRR